VIAGLHDTRRVARLLEHGLVATAHAEVDRVAPESTGRLLNQMGLYMEGRAQFKEALEEYQKLCRTPAARMLDLPPATGRRPGASEDLPSASLFKVP